MELAARKEKEAHAGRNNDESRRQARKVSIVPLLPGGWGCLGHSDLGTVGGLLDLLVDQEKDEDDGRLDDSKGDAGVEDSFLCPFHVLSQVDQRDHDKHASDSLHFEC